MADSDYKFEQYAIAYLDILGFTPKARDVQKLQQVAKALSQIEEVLLAAPTDKAKPHMFSDTIVVTFPDASELVGYGMTYLSLLQVFSGLQGMFLRGGIAHGDLYEKGQILFGPAYMQAYELEKQAVWARVLVHPSVMAIDPSPFSWSYLATRDQIGLPFIDYLRNAFSILLIAALVEEYTRSGKTPPLAWRQLFALHRVAILKEVKEADDQLDIGVLTKYHALAAYHNSVINRLVDTLQGWLSSNNFADTVAKDPYSHEIVETFLVAVARSGHPQSDDVAEFLYIKVNDLMHHQDQFKDGLIDLPLTFPALYSETRKT